MGERPPTTEPGTRALIAPRFLDIHRINATHEHIGMIYWARPKNGTLTLSVSEHHDIRWCSAADLDRLLANRVLAFFNPHNDAGQFVFVGENLIDSFC